MKGLPLSLSAASLAALLCASAGCGKGGIDRVEWPVMGTIAAVQVRATSRSACPTADASPTRRAFSSVELQLNAHSPTSEVSRLAPLPEDAILAGCHAETRPCYEAAFKLMKSSGGAFNPRWRGTNTLDLGAIAKGFAVDVAAGQQSPDLDTLLDLGGNIKSVRGEWKTGVKDPNGDGFAAVVKLREGEALATSATYYRGSHIYDGRTGLAVSNGVASVTVLCNSAMWADGLSTTLFVLGPEEGRAFLDKHLVELVGDKKVAVLWILGDGSHVKVDPDDRFAIGNL